jgi:adenylyltransferase/sulfurtransferase
MSQWRELSDADGFLELLRSTGGKKQTVLYCKSGGRSGQLLQVLHRVGATDVQHLRGGVLAWIDDVDPGQRKY